VADHVKAEKRSEIMRAVRSKDTSPELAVRKMVHAMGFRFRLHRADLPGKPDLVFPSRRKVIFVHGCFWHRHTRCRYTTTPKTRVAFWEAKFASNVQRDKRTIRKLRSLGWAVMTVWQCELKDRERLGGQLHEFLKD